MIDDFTPANETTPRVIAIHTPFTAAAVTVSKAGWWRRTLAEVWWALCKEPCSMCGQEPCLVCHTESYPNCCAPWLRAFLSDGVRRCVKCGRPFGP